MYNNTQKMIIIFALNTDDYRILLPIDHQKGGYALPSLHGFMEPGESYQDTFERLTTGAISHFNLAKLSFQKVTQFSHNNIPVHIYFVAISSHYEVVKLNLAPEAPFQWVSTRELDQWLCTQSNNSPDMFIKALESFVSYLKALHIQTAEKKCRNSQLGWSTKFYEPWKAFTITYFPDD